jgi:putative peptidoglycan lipid II flippase
LSTDQQSLLRSSGIVALGTAISRATGMLRLTAMAYAIGFKSLTDTFTLANQTPNIVYDLLVGGVLSATLVPVFVHHYEDRDDEGTSAVISVATVALIAITLIGIFLAPLIVRIYTLTAENDVAGAQRRVATDLLRLFMPQVFFYGLAALCTALLNARRRFAAAAFAPAINNLVGIAVLLAIPHVAGHAPSLDDVRHDTGLLLLLGLGTTAGIVAMALALVPAVGRSGFRFRWNFDLRNAAVREVGRMSGWTIGYVLTNQIALLVVLLLANRDVGGVSTYTAAYIFLQLPYALIAVSLMTTIGPGLASAATRGDEDAYREQFSLGVRLMALITLPAAMGYIVLGQPIANGLLKYGATKDASAHLIGSNLAMFGIGLFGFALYQFTLRGFYSHRDTRTPFFINCAENVLNIALALVLQPILGTPGLALALGLAYGSAALLALFALRRKVGPLDSMRVMRTIARILVATAVMGLAVAGAIRLYTGAAIVQTVLGVIVGAAVFGAAVLALRVEEIDALRARLARRTA